MVSAITVMMKTESFNWQRPAKICNGVKDFGLLREKLANADSDTDHTKQRNFSSVYISRAVFIVGVTAVITFVICLVLADKYQKSINLTHHYASFVYEKSRFERQHLERNSDDDDIGDGADENGRVEQSVFSAPGFVKLQNISNRLPIEEINLLVPVTTVLRSLNVSRNGRQYSAVAGDNFKEIPNAIIESAVKNVSQQSTTTAASTRKHGGIQSLADLLRRTELKAVVRRPSGGFDSAANNAAGSHTKTPNVSISPGTGTGTSNSTSTYTRTDTPARIPDTNNDIDTSTSASASVSTITSSTQQSSIHFAQLESYPRRTQPHNNNLQHLIEYINCKSSEDCWLKRQRQQNADAIATADHQHPNQIHIEKSKPTTLAAATQQPDHHRYHEYFKQLEGADHGDDYAHRHHYEHKAKLRIQATELHPYRNEVSSWFARTTDNGDGNGNDDNDNDNDSDGDGNGNGDDTMFTADTQAAPSYYSSEPYLALHRNRVDSDLFRKFRASSPVEINRLQLSDQTESATSVTAAGSSEHMPHHRFSNRMYHNRGGGGGDDNLETYTLDLDPYLKPPTPPPPTMLSFTPSYTTSGFHTFNDPSSIAMAMAPAPPPPSSAFMHDNDLRSEATAVQPLVSQVKPISLMVEIFPANEYELPASVFGGGGGGGGGSDNRVTGFAAQQRDQTYPTNQANVASLMSWKLAPFSQNKMRLLVNLFPQHRSPVLGDRSPLSDTTV